MNYLTNFFQDPVDRIKYYIQHRNQREEQILNTLASKSSDTWSAMDLVKVIYTETPENLHTAAAVNVTHHLNKLEKENKVKREGEDKFIILQ